MMSEDFTEYDDMYGATEPEAPKGPLPDGKYDAVISEVKMGRWQDGTPRVEWEFSVTDADYAGRLAWMNDGLDERKIGKTKGHFDACGFAGLPLSQIVRRMPELNGRAVKLTVSTYNGKSYTHLNYVAPLAGAPAQAPAPAPAPAQAPAQAEIPGTAAPRVPY